MQNCSNACTVWSNLINYPGGSTLIAATNCQKVDRLRAPLFLCCSRSKEGLISTGSITVCLTIESVLKSIPFDI